MPIYEYTCKDCKKDFVVSLSFKELDAKPTIKCQHCKSGKVEKKLGTFTAKTSRKS